MTKNIHHRSGDRAHNNPLRTRFNNPVPRPPSEFARTAYVLQGGGALGAYQMGVIKALLEAGYEPDWISATSIGAIQAAIIVGNHPEDRIAKLEQFWQRIATYSVFDILGYIPFTMDMYNKMSTNTSLLVGQKGFFTPRWPSPYAVRHGRPKAEARSPR